jgi:hypothetical protein
LTQPGHILLGSLLWVMLHLVLYVAAVRNASVFRQEKGIFLYHATSFAALFVFLCLYAALYPSQRGLQAAAGALAIHAIYSMSFLELWSLSQISYSIAILDAIAANPGIESGSLTSAFANTGEDKKTTRLSGLQKLRLIEIRKDCVTLAPRGRLVAAALTSLRRIANLRKTG